LPVRGALRSLINLPLAPMIAGDTSFARPIYAFKTVQFREQEKRCLKP